MLKICVISLEYVGLPICLKSSNKFHTTGFDTNSIRIKNLNKYRSNFTKFYVVLFLTKDTIFKKIHKKIKSKKPEIILNPFYYYNN